MNNELSTKISNELNCSFTKIVYISDLHFDFTNRKYKPDISQGIEDEFINVIQEYHRESILLLGGDFYNDYKKTLNFINRLESLKVFGFFVLGNHDYWNNGVNSIVSISLFFTEKTKIIDTLDF